MDTVTSQDGTTIAFDRLGDGPPVISVDGALGNRAFPPALETLLAERFTVIRYDRRGRNDSGDTPPYAVEREIEDLAALLEAAGGSACVYGMSSGAVLALRAAAAGLPVTRLAVYEPPFIVDDSRPPLPADDVEHLDELTAAGRRGEAVEYFMTHAVGVPAEFVAGMRTQPMWPALEAVAHTIAYDGRVMGGTMSGRPLRSRDWTPATNPTLVIVGEKSEPFMHTGTGAIAGILPDARLRVLEGQTHDVAPDVLAPVLAEFFSA